MREGILYKRFMCIFLPLYGGLFAFDFAQCVVQWCGCRAAKYVFKNIMFIQTKGEHFTLVILEESTF